MLYQKGILSPKTYRTYCGRIELINEHIGYIKLRNINAKILDKFYNSGISHMIERGVPISVISRKVGHSSVQVTDSIYSHFFEDEFKQTANSMDDIFAKVQ